MADRGLLASPRSLKNIKLLFKTTFDFLLDFFYNFGKELPDVMEHHRT